MRIFAYLVFGPRRVRVERSGAVSAEVKETKLAKKRIILFASRFGSFLPEVTRLQKRFLTAFRNDCFHFEFLRSYSVRGLKKGSIFKP